MVASDRAVLIRYLRDNEPRRGSGLLIGGQFVLTADHCANGADHRVIVDGQSLSAMVHVRSESTAVDIAVLKVPQLALAKVQQIRCALVNRSIADEVKGCRALGFPAWKNGVHGGPTLAQAGGYLPTAEGLNPEEDGGTGLLAFKITDPEPATPTVPKGDLDSPRSQWAGMSGAVIITEDDLVLGVVRSHSLSEGTRSLTVTGLEKINQLPQPVAALFWSALGVDTFADLPVLPANRVTDPTKRRLRRILELEKEELIYRSAAEQLMIEVVRMEFLGPYGPKVSEPK